MLSQVVPIGCSPGELIYMDMREAGFGHRDGIVVVMDGGDLVTHF